MKYRDIRISDTAEAIVSDILKTRYKSLNDLPNKYYMQTIIVAVLKNQGVIKKASDGFYYANEEYGAKSVIKECYERLEQYKINRQNRKHKELQQKLPLIDKSITQYTTAELIDELRKRGATGNVEFKKSITL